MHANASRRLDGACGGPCGPNVCKSWCSQYSCYQDGCMGCGPEIGCTRPPPPSPPSPPPSPPHPPLGPDGCKFRYENCYAAPSTCCSAQDGCYRRVGRRFAMCRPREPFCRDTEDWLCPTWQASPMPPPPPPPVPGSVSPPPPPLPGTVCSGFFERCLETKCCAVHSQLCYKREGKQFAMCKTIPVEKFNGNIVRSYPCDHDDLQGNGWICPERWLPSPPPPTPPSTPAPPLVPSPVIPPLPLPPPAAPRACAESWGRCVELQCCEDPEVPFAEPASFTRHVLGRLTPARCTAVRLQEARGQTVCHVQKTGGRNLRRRRRVGVSGHLDVAAAATPLWGRWARPSPGTDWLVVR